ncbi:MAG: NADH-quinone oxidoreductase subunit H [Nocardiopsaceae bacterium]|nr:NADH-quinone oxidoreductase subunit H [Nocardiopsaceae bacterium]
MGDPMPLWGMLLLPIGLLLLGYGGAAWSAILTARAAGSPVSLAAATPARETARLLVEQRRTIPGADTLLWRLGGATVPVAAVLAVLVLPVADRAAADLSIGVVWFNAMEVLIWVAVWTVGWGANSAWGLVGAYRFLIQGLAYALPHMFALTTAALGAGSLRVSDIAQAQENLWFAALMPVAFGVYLLSAMAMAYWGPFDPAVARDLAGGAAAELTGVDRLVFRSGRYLMLTAAAAMAVPLFLGGGAGPLLPGWAWTVLKTAAVLALLVWLGHRLPTVRVDRFTEIGWVVLIPATLLQALVVAIVVLVV